jgi:hypothetical protein
MSNASDRTTGTQRGAPPAGPDEAARRAAALEALSKGQPAQSASATFWEKHGGRIVLGGVLLLALVLVALGVGKFLRTSISETSRAEQDLRRGLR